MAQRRPPYSSVLDPAAPLAKAEKAGALARATGCTAGAAARVVSDAPRASLLDLKRAVDAAAPGKRAVDAAASGKQAASRQGPKRGGAAAAAAAAMAPTKVADLSEMLLEADHLSKKQARFEARMSAEPPAKKRRKDRTCAACLDDRLPDSSIVVCRYYDLSVEKSKHVYCCSCLRTYLLGSRLHGGRLDMMMCPGCEEVHRESMDPYDGGKKFHNVTRRQAPHFEKGDVSRVIGPLDELRMRDLRRGSAVKVKVPREVQKVLRRAGAKSCPYCGSYSERVGGCKAMVCANCTKIFNWEKAKS